MRAKGIARFYVHKATVATCTGTNGYGENVYAAPVDVQCFIDDTQHLVRSVDGEQVVSNTTIYTFPTNGPLFTPNSKVTWEGLPDGKIPLVIKANTNTAPGLNLPDHVAVTLE